MEHTHELQRIGDALRKLRSSGFASQEAFADSIRMHRAYYGAIELGKRNVTLATLSRISTGLGLKLSDVLREAGL